MIIKEKGLVIHNLLMVSADNKEEIVERAAELRQYIVKCDLFPTGPIIYTVADDKYEVGVPINEAVDTLNTGLKFQRLVEFSNCVYTRIIEEDEDTEKIYQELLAHANEKDRMVENEKFYNIVLDVYGETLLDVYLPIESEDKK